MAFTRKFLSALGIEAEKVDQIIDAHTEVTDSLKAERDKYKADAEKLPGVQKELDDLKAETAKNGKDPYKVKYEAAKEELDNYKKEQAAKETKAAKSDAYKALLKECGVSDKRIDAVLKVTDLDSLEMEDGKFKNAADLRKSIKEEWADFITTESTKGSNPATPPENKGGALKSREEIYKRDDSGRFVLDASQRQAALAQLIAAEQQKG